MNFEIITNVSHSNAHGELFVFENLKNVPFAIKRVYCIKNVPSTSIRGGHAHTQLEQLVICLAGSCKFLLDDGTTKTIVELYSPQQGLFIGKNLWRDMYDFSPDCILMVLASDFYDPEEYIRDYPTFLSICSA